MAFADRIRAKLAADGNFPLRSPLDPNDPLDAAAAEAFAGGALILRMPYGSDHFDCRRYLVARHSPEDPMGVELEVYTAHPANEDEPGARAWLTSFGVQKRLLAGLEDRGVGFQEIHPDGLGRSVRIVAHEFGGDGITLEVSAMGPESGRIARERLTLKLADVAEEARLAAANAPSPARGPAV